MAAHLRGTRGIGQNVAEESTERLAGGARQKLRGLPKRGKEITSQGASVRRRGYIGHQMIEDVHHQLDPARPAAIDRRLAGLCPYGHPLHRQVRVADLCELSECRLENRLMQHAAAAPRQRSVIDGHGQPSGWYATTRPE